MNDHNQIPEHRRSLYYIGLILTILGPVICFCSIAFVAMSMSSSRHPDPAKVFIPFIIGMGMMVVGAFVKSVGARGLAGSGLKLDPKEAREDLKPWSKMAGGILNDAGINLDMNQRQSPAPPPDFDEKLRKLHQLHADGILTDREYADQKAAVLDAMKK